MTSQLETDLSNAAHPFVAQITTENISAIENQIRAALFGVMDSYVADKAIEPNYNIVLAAAPGIINIQVLSSILNKGFMVRE